MQTETKHIVLIVIASVAMLLLLLFILIDLMLRYKNKQLKHQEEMLELNTKFEENLVKVRNEITKQVLTEIAVNLHDNIGQTLSLAVIHLNQLELGNSIDKNQLDSTRNIVKQAIWDVRELSHSMYSDYWQNFEINAFVQKLFKQLQHTCKYKLEFDIDNHLEIPSKDLEIVVIRILQELINNTIKHSKANTITLVLKQSDDIINVEYSDNGQGFNPAHKTKGKGLESIRQRLSLINAHWDIKTSIKQGFSITIRLPLTKEYE